MIISKSMKYESHSLEETQKIASDFVGSLIPKAEAVVVGLYGNLGAGKTAFTKCVASSLGINETVTSPTFVIEKIYPIRTNSRKRLTSNGASDFSHLIHIDAYRLEKSEELLHLGWKEIITDPKNIILIEWPENVLDIMPEHTKIYFAVLSGIESREIRIVD